MNSKENVEDEIVQEGMKDDTMQDLINRKRAHVTPMQGQAKSIARLNGKFKVLGALSVLEGLGLIVLSGAVGSLGFFAIIGGLAFIGIGIYLAI